MLGLGGLYESGRGVAQDYGKAREWYEKAADKGDVGVTQDYAKARDWYEKAAAKDNASAMAALERLPIREAAGPGRYTEALQLQEAVAAKVEAVETKRQGKPGEETAQALSDVAVCALLAREFTKALTVADRAHALLPDDLTIETNRSRVGV